MEGEDRMKKRKINKWVWLNILSVFAIILDQITLDVIPLKISSLIVVTINAILLVYGRINPKRN